MTPTGTSTARRELAAIAVCAVMGSAFVVTIVFLAVHILGYSDLDRQVTGTVVSQDGTSESCSSDVEYTVDGTDHQLGYGSCPGVGDYVTVRYDAADPADGTADGPWRVYVGFPLMIAGLGLCTGLFWFFGFRQLRKLRSRQEPDSLFGPDQA